MKELGLNTLVAHIDWYDVEPVRGRYEFSRSDVVVELAEKLDLHALLWPWPELEPEWPSKAFPDGLWTADDGLKPGTACWDRPQVREAVGRFITATVDRYRSRRVVMGWDVAAEPGLWISGDSLIREHGQARTYCYCPHTKARYRARPVTGQGFDFSPSDGSRCSKVGSADVLGRLARVYALEPRRFPAFQS